MASLSKLRPHLRTLFLHVPARVSARAFNSNIAALTSLRSLGRLSLILPEVHDTLDSRLRRQHNLRAVTALTLLTRLQVRSGLLFDLGKEFALLLRQHRS